MAASSVDTGVASTYKERGAVIDLRGSRLEPGEGVEPALRLVDERDYVEFWPAGVATSGWFLCAACGNTVIVRQVLPRCMLCGERLWERAQIVGTPASTAV